MTNQEMIDHTFIELVKYRAGLARINLDVPHQVQNLIALLVDNASDVGRKRAYSSK